MYEIDLHFHLAGAGFCCLAILVGIDFSAAILTALHFRQVPGTAFFTNLLSQYLIERTLGEINVPS